MDLEETQKANLLAETLQKNGIACSSSDAVDKANKIIHVTENKEPEGDIILSLERKYKLLLEQNNNKVSDEINNLKKSVNSLIAELNSIKNQISQQQEESIKKQEISNQPEKTEVQEKIEDTKEAKKDLHPKQGNFKPEDVSIEKFFYFGEK